MIKKLLIPILLLILTINPSFSSTIKLSDQSQVSLITCSPGKEIYELFGHTAIRVFDPANQIDIVFNYGLFSFEEPNFVGKFVRGKTDYEVGVQGFQDFVLGYAMRNSSVTEQIINYNQEEKQAIWEKLNFDILPENKKYRYNFVFNNCATRPRDIIERASDSKVIYPYNITPKTFREAIASYSQNAKWAKFGFDLCLGMNADKTATETELHFLPELLAESLWQTTVIQENGSKTNLTTAPKIIIEASDEEITHWLDIVTPFRVSWGLFILVFLVTVIAYIKKIKLNFLDGPLFFVAGSVGVVLFFLSYFSKHPFTDDNFNLIWLNPFWFTPIILSLIPFPKKKELILAFYIAVSVVLSIFILSMWAIPQYFNPAFIPLILLLLTRVASHVFYWGYKKDKVEKYYTRKKRSKK